MRKGQVALLSSLSSSSSTKECDGYLPLLKSWICSTAFAQTVLDDVVIVVVALSSS
jgi:hypothetical protein